MKKPYYNLEQRKFIHLNTRIGAFMQFRLACLNFCRELERTAKRSKNNRTMDKLIEAKNRIKDAILAMHPLLNMGDAKEEELYLALHNLNDIVHERVRDELLSVPQANELLPHVSGMFSAEMLEQAYRDGLCDNYNAIDDFNIENYR